MKITNSQVIASQLTSYFISQIPHYAFQKKAKEQRPLKIRDNSIQFMSTTFSEMNHANNMNYTGMQKITDQLNEIQQHSLTLIPQKYTIRKQNNLRRSSLLSSGTKSPRRYSRIGIGQNFEVKKKNNQKGLVKLLSEETEDENYSDFIQRQRQKKIRLAEAMTQFQKNYNQTENPLMGYQTNHSIAQKKNFDDTNQNIDNGLIGKEGTPRLNLFQSKAIITNFDGEILPNKTQRKKKKNEAGFWEKGKVKLTYKLKEPICTQKQLLKLNLDSESEHIGFTMNSQANSITNIKRQDKNSENYKSILDEYNTRKTIEFQRSHRNNFR